MGGVGFFVVDGVKILAHADAIGEDDNPNCLEEHDSNGLAAHALGKSHHFAFYAGLLFVGYVDHTNFILQGGIDIEIVFLRRELTGSLCLAK